MAKKAQHINRFDGGLNDSSSQNKIENNQLPSVNNVQFDKHGLIRQMGQSVKTTENNLDTIASTISPGYGLHQFNTGTTATNASHSLISNVCEPLLISSFICSFVSQSVRSHFSQSTLFSHSSAVPYKRQK